MLLDSGRIEDMKRLEQAMASARNAEERQKYQGIMDNIRRQAENTQLARQRENLMEARRKGLREEGDKLEEYIDKEFKV